MSETITLEQLQTAQNNFINQRTAEINQLKQNTAAALQNLSALGQRVYGYNHTSFAVKDINTVYDEIIEANPALASKSAIGFTALLNSGETVSKQGNRMFIYGKAPETEGADVEIEEEFEDYTFTGEGKEFVTVWYFKNGDLPVNYAVNDLYVVEAVVKKSESGSDSDFDITTGALDYIQSIELKNIKTTTAARFVALNGFNGNELTTASLFANHTKKINSNVKTLKLTGSFITRNHTKLQECNLTELTSLICNETSGQMFQMGAAGGNNVPIDINFPKLKTIYNRSNAMFAYFYNLTLPESLNEVTGAGLTLINTVFNALSLNCNNLESMPENWYVGTAPLILNIASNWGCSISLTSATPVNWDKTNYIDLFTNKLRDMTLTDETRTLKIPTAIYNALTAEEIAIATAKGWTITHP